MSRIIYPTVHYELKPYEIATIICEIEDSKEFELDEEGLCHIVIKGAQTREGYSQPTKFFGSTSVG